MGSLLFEPVFGCWYLDSLLIIDAGVWQLASLFVLTVSTFPFFTMPFTAGTGAKSDGRKGFVPQIELSDIEACLTGIELPFRGFSSDRLLGTGIATLGVLSAVVGGLRARGLGDELLCLEVLSTTVGGLRTRGSPAVLLACLLSRVDGGLNISSEDCLPCLDVLSNVDGGLCT